MGGAGKKVQQAGRWFDKEVLQSKVAGAAAPFLVLPYQAASGTGWFDGPKAGSLPAPPARTPDLMDQALLLARQRDRKRGSRQGSYLSGVLGDQSSPTTRAPSLTGR